MCLKLIRCCNRAQWFLTLTESIVLWKVIPAATVSQKFCGDLEVNSINKEFVLQSSPNRHVALQ